MTLRASLSKVAGLSWNLRVREVMLRMEILSLRFKMRLLILLRMTMKRKKRTV
ncbi:hypothetical protein LEMLEM_LOCUS5974, partial [Lemmus lemmus]